MLQKAHYVEIYINRLIKLDVTNRPIHKNNYVPKTVVNDVNSDSSINIRRLTMSFNGSSIRRNFISIRTQIARAEYYVNKKRGTMSKTFKSEIPKRVIRSTVSPGSHIDSNHRKSTSIMMKKKQLLSPLDLISFDVPYTNQTTYTNNESSDGRSYCRRSKSSN